MDIDRELAALDSCLAEMPHPLRPAMQERALDVAAGIIAGSRPADRFSVATRLEMMLLRHGLTACCHTLPKADAWKQGQLCVTSSFAASGEAGHSHQRPGPAAPRASRRSKAPEDPKPRKSPAAVQTRPGRVGGGSTDLTGVPGSDAPGP